MTRERDIQRVLDHWFAERPTEVPDRVLDEVADRIGRQPQQPAWLTLWRDSHVNTYLKYAAAVAAVILVAVVGFAVLRPTGAGIGGQPVSPSPSLMPSIAGTYASSFSQDELAASPDLYDVGEINNGNWGDFTLTFEGDGRVTMFQSNALGSSITRGTYEIDRDHILLAFSEGANKGETFGGRWSLDRDTLTFVRVDCRDSRVPCFRGSEELPTPYLVKAWTRVP